MHSIICMVIIPAIIIFSCETIVSELFDLFYDVLSIFREAWKDIVGDLFLPCNMPEAPKQGFLRNLFVGTPIAVDREELCMWPIVIQLMNSVHLFINHLSIYL